jgi:glycerol-3-phosphate dehydrogenase
MRIALIGGGINGLATAWHLAQQGHEVTLYERDQLMGATSRASSKLLHGGLRYLENREFRLVHEALHERDAWLTRVPQHAHPIRLVYPVYRGGRRPRWMIGAGMLLYDLLAGRGSHLPSASWEDAAQLCAQDPGLNAQGLRGGYVFSDGMMDDHALGLWVAQQAEAAGVTMREHTPVDAVDTAGGVVVAGEREGYDRVVNVAGPWAVALLARSGLTCPYRLDLVRGSHLVLDRACPRPYLLEAPGERRVFFVLPWKGRTLVGTTEVRQALDEPIVCSAHEEAYLLRAYGHYFPGRAPAVVERFAGVRPLLYSAADPGRATREYVLHRDGQLVTVLGGKWTTALALARTVAALTIPSA